MFRKALLLIFLCFAGQLHGFVAPMSLPEKARGSDTIVRGVVLKIIPLSIEVSDSRGPHPGKIPSEKFAGPNCVALVRVIEAVKGKVREDVIFVPCGYNFDESPGELTEAKEYLLFLKSMGNNYHHPLHASCTHLIENSRVSISGNDHDGDFEPDEIADKTVSYADFVKQIREANASTMPDGKQKD